MLDDIGRKHLEDHVQKLDDEKSRQLLAQIKAEEGGEFHFPDYLLSGDPELDRDLIAGHEYVLSLLEKSLERRLQKGSN